MNELKVKRTPEIIGADIRRLVQEARIITLWYGIQIGRNLTEAKEMVDHGEWLEWLARETEISQPTASRFMRLYKEYGVDQGSLFGVDSKYSTLNNLSISNALQLLAFPESEREQAAVELDAENLSSRELAEAIAARKAAEERAKTAETERAEMAKEIDSILEDRDQLDELRAKTEDELKAARQQIKELESRPVEVAVERDEQAIQEAAAQAKAKADAEASEKIAALQKKLDKAEKERDKLKDAAGKAETGAADKIAAAEREAAKVRQELDTAKKQLAASDKDVTEFGVWFKAVQTDLGALSGCMEKIKGRDAAMAAKLAAALKTVLSPYVEGTAEEGGT